MRLNFIILLGLLAWPAMAQTGAPADRIERRVYLMGTLCSISTRTEHRAEALAVIQEAFDVIAGVEERLSTWKPESDLSRLNRTPVGRPVPLTEELFDLLLRVEQYVRETAGAFDPAVGSLVDAWDIRGGGRTPDHGELQAARRAAGMHLFRLHGGTATRMPPGPRLDAGAFGKGAALTQAAAVLEEAGLDGWVIDFGGQVVVAPGPHGEPVAVSHPRFRDRPVATLLLDGLSAATSSQAERPGHILDPRNGQPVAAFGSVTAISRDPLLADVMSTALFVMGPEAGLAFAEARQDLEALFLVDAPTGLQARSTTGMQPLLKHLEPAGMNKTKGKDHD